MYTLKEMKRDSDRALFERFIRKFSQMDVVRLLIIIGAFFVGALIAFV